MEHRSHWKFDGFFDGAGAMRKAIDDHFTESAAGSLPFEKRAIWNYWYIPLLYTYFRCQPAQLFPEAQEAFMRSLKAFAAREFGLAIPTVPFLSMYVNGCGQHIHNDAHNGRLAYVYSLTRWKERRFTGGETLVYKADDMHQALFTPGSAWAFYDYIEPEFNRLALFDDRFPHAVTPLQGTMDPKDARFVIHGHMEDPDTFPFVEGGLSGKNMEGQFKALRDPIGASFTRHGRQGFITFSLNVKPSGAPLDAEVKHMQLLPRTKDASTVQTCLDNAMTIIGQTRWPEAASPSKLVFALGSERVR